MQNQHHDSCKDATERTQEGLTNHHLSTPESEGKGANNPTEPQTKEGGKITRLGSGLAFAPVEPWPEPVDGQALLNDLESVVKRFVILPSYGAETLALWCLHTYAFQLREVSTYLGIESPEKRCGKTTLLSVLSELAHRTVTAANISSSALFRVIEETQPTLLIDEADTFLQGNDELRGILNSGYTRKTAFVVRVAAQKGKARQVSGSKSQVEGLEEVSGSGFRISGCGTDRVESGHRTGEGSRLVRFSCWCPKVMAAIGRLPETLADRCIVLRMQRKTAMEECERLRNLEPLDLKRRCLRFVQDNVAAIASARPELPFGLNDRAGDIWEPLFTLADLVGGGWPERARMAALGLAAHAQENCPIGALLQDILLCFARSQTDRLHSRDIVNWLVQSENRPWADGRNGKPVTESWLSRQLRPYGIRPRSVWIGDVSGKGYLQTDFHDAFLRYIPGAEADAFLKDLPEGTTSWGNVGTGARYIPRS